MCQHHIARTQTVYVQCGVLHGVCGHFVRAPYSVGSSWQIEEPLQYEFMKMDEMRTNPTEDMQSEC